MTDMKRTLLFITLMLASLSMTPQTAYRPFVEDGKVWRVGAFSSGNPVQWIEYYYFDGDTIINEKVCKQMMRQRFVNPIFAESNYISQENSSGYVGAWYEEDQKVYTSDTTSKQFHVMYDFSANDYDTLRTDKWHPYVIGPRQTGDLKGFKGVYRDLWQLVPEGSSYCTTWLEGVGGIDGPVPNVCPGKEDHALFLISCTVGDEVIYLNDEYHDGTVTDASNAPKQRLDFTHIIKTKPKAPRKRSAEQPLYGEYNDQLLDINLDPLDEAYLVRIIGESGKAVYEKAINAGNIVALSIDISTYPQGRYTVTIENSLESFTGQFHAQTTGIIDAARLNNNEQRIKNKLIYSLQGQRLSRLQKGLNIVNGRKVLVK